MHFGVFTLAHVPSAPIETSFTPLLAMKSRALFTLLILWTLILPRSGLGNRSPADINIHGNKHKVSTLASAGTRAEHVSTGSAEQRAVSMVKVTAVMLAPLTAEKN